jgi:hypothetical protein
MIATMARSWFFALVVVAACGGDGPTPFQVDSGVPSNTILLDDWKNTMQIGDFHSANMSMAWSTMKTSNDMLCTNPACHTEYGSADEAFFFSQVQQDQEILTRFFAIDSGHIIVNDAAFQAASTHTAPAPSDHPPFDPSTAIGLQALRSFYTLTCTHQPSLCGM